MDLPPILLKNPRGIVLMHLYIYKTRNEKLWKNSNIAIFENEPELNLGLPNKSFIISEGLLGKNVHLKPNKCIEKYNTCKIAAVSNSGCRSKI